jgi:hypothetical protein
MSTEAIEERSLRLSEFRKAEGNMSGASYYKMLALGLGPTTTVIPGTSIQIVTPEARREWRHRIAKYNEENAEKLRAEHEARSLRARRAGKGGSRAPSRPPRTVTAAPTRSATRGGR